MRSLLPLALSLFCLPAFAATFTVTNSNDAGSGSLRQAIADANSNNGADIVDFDASTNGNPILLTSGSIIISDDLTITGNGHTNTTISGNNNSRVFDMFTPGVDLTIEDVRIIDADGGALNYAGTQNCTITGCYFKDNTSSLNGGAILFSSTNNQLVVDDCTFEGNSSTSDGGAIQITNTGCQISYSTFDSNTSTSGGGAIKVNDGVNSFTNCTFYGNSSNVGGAMRVYFNPGSEIVNCTFANNNANSIGGAIAQTEADQLYVNMRNTIVADNTSGGNGADIYLELGMAGLISNNIVEDCHSANASCPTWYSSADPSLDNAGLQNNGGTTETVALQCNSIAIDAGTSVNSPNTDQRGFGRVDSTDIGAYEFTGSQNTVNNDTICEGQSVTVGTSTYSTSGTYMDTLTGSNNCDSIVTTNLTVTTIDTTVTNNGGTLMADQDSATYQWINCNGMTAISNETNQSYTPSNAGSYAVAITKNGCTDTSGCHTVVGLAEYQLQQQIHLFPNPASEMVTIQLGQAGTVQVYNAIGKLVWQTTRRETTVLLNVSELPKGVYMLKANETVRKLVVE